MRKFYLLSTLVVTMLLGIRSYAQEIDISLKKYLGGSGTDYGQFVTTTNDGNLLVIGVVQSSDGMISGYHGGTDIWVAKLSTSGAIQWQRTLGGSDNETAVSYAYNKLDGSVVIAGNTYSANGDVTVSRGTGDIWVVKINSTGTMLWQKTFGGSLPDVALNIINTSDGNYLLSAETWSNNNDITGSHGGSEIWLAKLNTAGTIVWKRCYGSTGNESGNNNDGFGSSLIESPAGNYVFSANAGANDGDVSGYTGGGSDAWVVNTNSSGTILWQKCVGGTGLDFARKLRTVPNGNFVLLAQSASPDITGYHTNGASADNFDVLLAVIQPNGILLRQKCFGSRYNEFPFELQTMNDSNFVFAAKVQKNGGDVIGVNTQDESSKDIWIVKTNDTAVVWKKTFGGQRDETVAEWTGNGLAAGDLKVLQGSGLMFTAITRSNDGTVVRSHPYGNYFDYDIWLFTLDSLGNIQTQNTLGEGNNEWAGSGMLDSLTNTWYFLGSSASYNNNTAITSTGQISDMFLYKFPAMNFLKGYVYFDNNSNNTRDANEPLVSNAWINAIKPAAHQEALTVNGNYLMQMDTGSYTISCVAPKPYFNILPVSASRTFNYYFRTDSVHFALQPIPNKRDLAVSVLQLKEVRQDSTVNYRIVYYNQGTDTVAAGTVEFKKDNRTAFIQASPDTTSSSGDTLRWNYTNLKPFEKRTIDLVLKAANAPILNSTDTVRHYAQILPDATDLKPADNRDTVYQPVVTAAVSGGKFSNTGKYFYQQQITDSGYINYTVRFQNTTTGTVANMFVTDTLDVAVDTTSFQMTGASHSYSINIVNGNKVTWTFNNIQLPNNVFSDINSRGFISFRVRLKGGTASGTIVNNKAYITFDNNTPVTTNTVTTEVQN